MCELELATTDDLIRELMSRKTFVGFVLKAQEEHKDPKQIHRGFDLYTMSDEKSTLQMLEKAVLILKG
jgi:hypothetical protein